jgi:hypothetical protein
LSTADCQALANEVDAFEKALQVSAKYYALHNKAVLIEHRNFPVLPLFPQIGYN